MPFRPNLSCVLTKHDGLDIYSQPKKGKVINERCAVVLMAAKTTSSVVRAGSSASMGAAEERTVDAVILMSAFTKAEPEDLLEVAGTVIRITGKTARRGLNGRLDHYEITGNIWR